MATPNFLYPGMILNESGIVNIKNKSHSITADIEVPSAKAEGVIVAQGANFGGWALYARDGRLKYSYNFLGLSLYTLESAASLSQGKHEVRMDFKYDGNGLGKGGNATLFIDDKKVGEARIEHTVPIIFSADSTCMVGDKIGAPISNDFKESGNKFTGKINWVRIEAGLENTDQLIKPDEWVRVKMSIQ
jgi:hypothetical protein